MATLVLSDSEESSSEKSSSDEETARIEEPPCPYHSVAECVAVRQNLETERKDIRKKLEGEGGRGEISLLEIEHLQSRSEDVADRIAQHSLWLVKMQKEKLASQSKLLPIANKRANIIRAVEENRVVIITGSTGCGKSTQIPQILLDSCQQNGREKPVLVVQTRRIATASLAARVALERGEILGKSVGFTIGGLNASTKEARIRFVTTGVLLAMLTSGDALRKYSFVVVDEVHERTLEIDMALSILRTVMRKKNTRLKIVIMSATMDSFRAKLQAYFKSVNIKEETSIATPPVVISSRQPPNYKVAYIEDIDYESIDGLTVQDYKKSLRRPKKPSIPVERVVLAVKLLKQLHETVLSKGCNVLVFVPGIGDMTELYARLERVLDMDSVTILNLHSSVSTEDQNRIYHDFKGDRLIVLSTNIAESAITIPSLQLVIDFCLHKENRHDYETNVSSLNLDWVSKAMSTQRAGRCGRSFAGLVYRMVTKPEHDSFSEITKPEVLVASLQTTCLKILNMRWLYARFTDVQSFLFDLLDPPESETHVKSALRDLCDMKCIEGNSTTSQKLTYMGKLAALFPLDVQDALLLVNGYMYGCLDDAFIIAAIRSRSRSVIVQPFKQPVMATMLGLTYAGPCLSDEISAVNAYHFWQKRRVQEDEKEWCLSKGLSLPALRETHDSVLQLRTVGSKMGLCVPPSHAEKGRKLEEKIKSVELLAATDVEETASISLGLERNGHSVHELTQELLLNLTLSASDAARQQEDTRKKLKKNVRRQLEAAYSASDAKLLSWLLEDAIRETEMCHLPVDRQFGITACLAASRLQHLFVIGNAPHTGGYPLSEVKGDISDFYLDLELSHEMKFETEEDYADAKKQIEDQLRTIRTAHNTTTVKKIKGEPTLPVRGMVFRPLKKRVEIYLMTSAVGGDSDAGWYCQAGCHKTYVLRIASRLLDRQLIVPKPIAVEDATEKPSRNASGTLKLPGKKSHVYLKRETLAVSKAKPHHSVAACGLLAFAAKKTMVMPRSSSIGFPFMLHRPGMVGWGVGSRVSGRKSRLFSDSGTVVMGAVGSPELMVLLTDASVDVARVQYNDERSKATVEFSSGRNNVRRSIMLELPTALLTQTANMREVGVQKFEKLYVSYVEHLKALHGQNMLKNDQLPPFDPTRLVQNTWANPLCEHADTGDCPSADVSEPPPTTEDSDGIIREKKGYAVVGKKQDVDFFDEITLRAATSLGKACEPSSGVLSLPNSRATLLTGGDVK